MIWIFLWLAFWIILWMFFKLQVPEEFVRYIAVVLIWLFDAIFWALRADVDNQQFNSVIFFSWLIFNAVLWILITLLWEILWLNLYLAATVVFTFRIFQNIWITRRILLEKWIKNKGNKKN